MTVKLCGVIFVILACSGFGFSMAASYVREMRALRNLIATVNFMRSELQFRNTALPDLCANAARMTSGCISGFFSSLAAELESQICPNTEQCVINALTHHRDIPRSSCEAIRGMGKTLGSFGLSGQLDGLTKVSMECEEVLSRLSQHQDLRVRSYQTLGVCAGAALAILLV